jgi:tetratricopeptide (TPR) repeat protein
MGLMAAAWMILGGIAAAEAPQQALNLLRHGKLRRAHRAVVDGLYETPDDADLQAAYGAVLAKGGRNAEAIVAFELAAGSAWYEASGIPFHARALAQVGRSEEAVQLRSEFELAGGRRPGASLGVRTGQVEDHVLGGRPDLAVEVALRATEEYPTSPVAFAALVEAYVAAEDLDAASWAVLRGESFEGSRSSQMRMARMRWHIEMGDYDAAWDISEDYRRKRIHDSRLWADRARIHRLRGQPGDGYRIAILDRFSWGLFIDLRLEGSLCAEAMGDPEAARQIMAPLIAGYSGHPDVAARLVELGLVNAP